MNSLTPSIYLPCLPEALKVSGDWGSKEITLDGEYLDSRYSLRVVNHSPNGFNWGYGGSGPAQLSLAILLEYLPYHIALKFYQDFKFKVVGGWPQSDFKTVINLRQILNELIK